MADLVCNSCNTPALESALFCYHCGQQVRCISCLEPLVAGANNCITCGTPVKLSLQNNSTSNPFINTIKLRENKDERIYELEFTNEVGREIKEVVADLLKNKMGAGVVNGSQPMIIRQLQKISNNELSEPVTDDNNTGPDNQLHQAIANDPVNESGLESYPHLNDVILTLNCKENEWLLIFAFYKSNYGTTTFSKEVVWHFYKEKRKTETRFKNLGTNWKSLFKKYICTVKENEFRFTTQGLEKVKTLLLADHTSVKGNFASRKSGAGMTHKVPHGRARLLSRKIAASTIVPDEFDVYQNEWKESLESFMQRKAAGNGNPNRIVAIGYYITHINHQEYFTEGNIDYAYRILNITGKPVHLKQVITNLKNERIWFQKVNDRGVQGWRLTRQAEIYVEEKLG